MMTSHSSSPALSNLPLPRISLEQPSERTGGEIYSHASEIHPTIFLHNCRQQREREREIGGFTAEKTGAAPCGRNQREVRPSALSSRIRIRQPPLSSGLFHVIFLRLSECKNKKKKPKTGHPAAVSPIRGE